MGCGCASERTFEEFKKQEKSKGHEGGTPLTRAVSESSTNLPLSGPGDLGETMIKTSLRPLSELYQSPRLIRASRSTKLSTATHVLTNKSVALFQLPLSSKPQALSILSSCMTLDHPHILRLYEVIEDRSHCYLIYEHFHSDLKGIIGDFGPKEEVKVGKIMYQVMKGLQAAHAKKVIFTKIDPSRITIQIDENTGEIIAKLGIFDRIGTRKVPKKLSPYTAPEVSSKNRSEKMDIWSCGVVMYALLCGEQTLKGIHTQPLVFPDSVSEEIQGLVRRMLCVNPGKRPSASEVLAHPWLQQFQEQPSLSARPIRKALQRLSTPSPTHPAKAAFSLFLLYRLTPDIEINQLSKVFMALDRDGDGELGPADLVAGLNQRPSPTQTPALERNVASNRPPVTFSEFVLSATDKSDVFSPSNLEIVFNLLVSSSESSLSLDSCKPLLYFLRSSPDRQSLLSSARSSDLRLPTILQFFSNP